MSAEQFQEDFYQADRVRIAFAGVSISKGPGASGVADGDFVRIKPDGPSFLSVKGTDGTIARSKSNDRLTEITIRIMQFSKSNEIFSAMLEKDESQPGGAGIGSFALEDLQGKTIFFAAAAWVIRLPEQAFAEAVTVREWVLHAQRDTSVIAGS